MSRRDVYGCDVCGADGIDAKEAVQVCATKGAVFGNSTYWLLLCAGCARNVVVSVVLEKLEKPSSAVISSNG